MSRLGGMMRSTRPKKLTSKQPIPIFREDQIDIIEDDLQTTLQAIDTGVEKAEETVSHIPHWCCSVFQRCLVTRSRVFFS